MAKRLKTHIDELRVLKKAKPSLRKALLKSADNSLICCLSECSHNILNGNVKLSPAQKKALQRHRNNLRQLATKKVPLKRKRELLAQRGGFLPALIGPILGIAASLIPQLLK
jgi:hypothetical protein